MATINFPTSPTVGQEYPFGGFIYVYDGQKWTSKVTSGGMAFVQETAPSTEGQSGSTWFCTANGISYVLFKDADSSQWIEANPNVPQGSNEITPAVIGAVNKAGDTMEGQLVGLTPVEDGHMATKGYVDGVVDALSAVYAQLTGDVFTGGVEVKDGTPLHRVRLSSTSLTPRMDFLDDGDALRSRIGHDLASGILYVGQIGGASVDIYFDHIDLTQPTMHLTPMTTNPQQVVRRDFCDVGFSPVANGAVPLNADVSNDNGTSICVTAWVQSVPAPGPANVSCHVNGLVVGQWSGDGGGVDDQLGSITFFVPAGSVYRINATNATISTVWYKYGG